VRYWERPDAGAGGGGSEDEEDAAGEMPCGEGRARSRRQRREVGGVAMRWERRPRAVDGRGWGQRRKGVWRV